MAVFEEGILLLESLGIVDVLLPFLLIFTIMFAVLQKAKILGEEKKNFNVIIALVIALSVIIPHVLGTYPSGYDVIDIINTVIPQISLLAVAFIMLMVLAGIVGVNFAGKSFAGIFVFISLIAVIAIFGGSLGWWNSGWFYDIFGEEAIALSVMILVFGIIIWFITSDSGGGAKKIGEGLKEFGNFFAGK